MILRIISEMIAGPAGLQTVSIQLISNTKVNPLKPLSFSLSETS